MTTVEGEAISRVGRLFKTAPSWLLVFLFFVLAACFALAGMLDDWLRAILAITFAAIAVTLAARFVSERPSGTADTPPVQPSPAVYRPEDPSPDAG